MGELLHLTSELRDGFQSFEIDESRCKLTPVAQRPVGLVRGDAWERMEDIWQRKVQSLVNRELRPPLRRPLHRR